MKKLITMSSILLLPLAVSGCMFHGGESRHVNPTTLGQELLDLQLALEHGAISNREFSATKEQLMSAERWQNNKEHHLHHSAGE